MSLAARKYLFLSNTHISNIISNHFMDFILYILSLFLSLWAITLLTGLFIDYLINEVKLIQYQKITERNTSRTGLTQPFCMTLQAQ
jgi:hypothetical protein